MDGRPTPEFVRWSLDWNCSYRDQPADSELTERQLRNLRAASRAISEHRCYGDVCLSQATATVWRSAAADKPALGLQAEAPPQEPAGFLLSDALATYGGLQAARAACGDCPANAAGGGDRVNLAGCFGMLFAADDRARRAVDSLLSAGELAAGRRELFPPTRPPWYGVWLADEPTTGQLAWLREFAAALRETSTALTGLADFQRAVAAALEGNLVLRLALNPAGRVVGRRWIVAAHCPRCRAHTAADRRGCRVCGRSGRPLPERVRMARGSRPYTRLEDLLSSRDIAALRSSVCEEK